MKPYGIITSHCSVPGHGTRCEVAEEISLGTNHKRALVKRRWRKEVQEDLEGDPGRPLARL